ncbi:hypothetical protein [Halomonas sp. YLGW01]|uniref:hypothetical protein n=1 Tax=Halomonas sp. YLGW01 TaxID=2773308 RepID=UPI001785F488|nr:hypothetical protein [Halomonas sp. YLGW01]
MNHKPLRQRRLAGLLLGLALAFIAPLSALADGAVAPPRAFEATYRLEIEGWPDTDVTHRLRREGDAWISEMRARIAVASGWERSRFTLESDRVTSRDYASGYSLLGISKDYRMGRDELGAWPDRQAALFALSRQAEAATCWHPQVAPCTLTYTDYEGEEKRFHYRRLETTTLELPAGTFSAVTVALWRSERPGRDLRLTFSPRLPGLLLAADYFKDGERKSRMRLHRLRSQTLARAN